MLNEKGFTLIELIIVIVLLGILAATALPRFVDFSGDANASIQEMTSASIESAAYLATNFCRVNNLASAAGDLSANGTDDIHFNSSCIPDGARTSANGAPTAMPTSGSSANAHAMCNNLMKTLMGDGFSSVASTDVNWSCASGADWCVRRVNAGTSCQLRHKYDGSANFTYILYIFSTGKTSIASV